MLQSVTICYDSDSAGIEAAYKAGEMLQKANCQVKSSGNAKWNGS